MNNLPFLQRLQTSLGNYFRPEQGQNAPPEVSSFVPSSPTPPAIGRTIRGMLANQPQVTQRTISGLKAVGQGMAYMSPFGAYIQGDENRQRDFSESLGNNIEQFLGQGLPQEMSPLDKLLSLLQLLMQKGGDTNAKSREQTF